MSRKVVNFLKNILLLGNGFDLYYKLPTKYDNFLHVVDFLQNHREAHLKTIGDVFSQQSLQETDPFIKICYEAHKKTYDSLSLDENDVNTILRLTDENIWFSYLKKVFNKDVGWIDFEQEISFVLKCFETAFKKSTTLNFKFEENHIKYVITLFDFFVSKVASNSIDHRIDYKVNSDYRIEKPFGSKNEIINTEKVVDKLYEELSNLSKALILYLRCFIESTYELLKKDGSLGRIEFFSHIERVVTFNYTHTYENLYFNNIAFHIHGNTENEIVLGINPDESDNLSSIDTTFVSFKKYYQRTLFETDMVYIRWINELVDSKTPYRLFTMGHSLDITDKDIIEELFKNAKEIVILYHSLDAKKFLISNLIKLFGKNGFDILKKEKKLTFTFLNQDLSLLKHDLGEESWNDLFSKFHEDVGEQIIPV